MVDKSQNNSTLYKPSGIVAAVANKSRARRTALKSSTLAEVRLPPNRNDLTPPLKFEHRKVSSLTPANRKLRKSNSKLIADLEGSIGQFGICGAVLITEAGEIIDGHMLVDVCISQAIEDVPCLVVSHLSNADIRRLRISLNRIQEKGEWDLTALEAEIKDLNIEFGADLFIPGIEPPILDGFLLDDIQYPATETIRNIDQAARIVTQLHDVWKLDRHVIACADARDLNCVAQLLETHFSGLKVRLNFSDLPYNVKIQGHVTGGDHREFVMASGEMKPSEFLVFLIASLRVIFETTIDGGIVMLFMDWRGLKTLLQAGEEVGFSLLNIVVWAKSNAGMGSLYRSGHEFVVVFKKGNASHVNNIELGSHGRYRTNVWEYPGASSLGSDAREHLKDHPTPKPVALLEDAILDVTDRGDLVSDSFVGSGSTLIAAEKTGRNFCGTELDPGYVDVTLHRWMELTGKIAILQDTGETWNEVTARRALEGAKKIEPASEAHPYSLISTNQSERDLHEAVS